MSGSAPGKPLSKLLDPPLQRHSGRYRGSSMGLYEPHSDSRPVNNISTVVNLLSKHRSTSTPTAELT